MIDIRLPNINAQSETDQLKQIKSYLYQFAEQLNWALNTMSAQNSVQQVPGAAPAPVTEASKAKDAEDNFQEVKALIIKSADIVNAYYDEINKRLESTYVAQSEFGEYYEASSTDLRATARELSAEFTNMQAAVSNVLQTNAWIKAGLLNESTGTYGLEVGQTQELDGEKTFAAFARFTADRLSFFSSSGAEVAYISNYMLHITKAKITDSMLIGGYEMLTANGGLAFRWNKEVS